MRVAVVIPLYNKAPYIGRALRSVLVQTRPPDEVIVVDDGSTDGGREVVKALGTGTVKLISQANAGVSAARNRGVSEANSDMIAFLDADDEWHPRFLERCAGAAERFPEAVAVFTNFRRSSSRRPELERCNAGPVMLDDYFAFAVRNRGLGMWSSAVMIRRDVLLEVGGFPEGETLGEDLDTWTRLAWSGSVVYVPEVLAIYHEDDPMSLTRAAQSCRPLPLVRTYEQWLAAKRIPPRLVRSSLELIKLQNRGYVARLLLLGQRREAMKALRLMCAPSPYRWDYAKLWIHCLLPEPFDLMARALTRKARQLVRVVYR